MRFPLLYVAAILIPSFASSEEYRIGDLVIDRPVAKTTPKSANSGAGYLSIMNMGDAVERLVAVEAAFPRVEIHDVKVENDVASMFQIDGVTIAPGETITFAPGGKHVMFMGLNGDPFEEGESISATLVFENAGAIDIVFDVQTLAQITGDAGAAEMDHGGHNHSGHGDDKKEHDHSNH